MSDVDGMEAVRVLMGVYRLEDQARIDVRRQRHLYQNPVDILAAVERFDGGEELGRRDRFRRRQLFAEDTEFGAGFDFVADVDFGGGVVTDQDDRESGRTRELLDTRSQLGQDLRSHYGAVQNLRHAR